MLWQPALPEKYTSMSEDQLADAIFARKRELGSDLVILGHHYQQDSVIQFADHSSVDAAIRVSNVFILLNCFIGCFIGQVRSIKSSIEKHWLFWITPFNDSIYFSRHKMCAIAFLTQCFTIALPVQPTAVHMIPKADATG